MSISLCKYCTAYQTLTVEGSRFPKGFKTCLYKHNNKFKTVFDEGKVIRCNHFNLKTRYRNNEKVNKLFLDNIHQINLDKLNKFDKMQEKNRVDLIEAYLHNAID